MQIFMVLQYILQQFCTLQNNPLPAVTVGIKFYLYYTGKFVTYFIFTAK